MKFIKDLFWNDEQGRLRAAYRILIQLTLYFHPNERLGGLTGHSG